MVITYEYPQDAPAHPIVGGTSWVESCYGETCAGYIPEPETDDGISYWSYIINI